MTRETFDSLTSWLPDSTYREIDDGEVVSCELLLSGRIVFRYHLKYISRNDTLTPQQQAELALSKCRSMVIRLLIAEGWNTARQQIDKQKERERGISGK